MPIFAADRHRLMFPNLYYAFHKKIVGRLQHLHHIYRVIHKSLRNFRTRLRNNQERHGRKEHINRYRISQSFFFVLGALTYLQVPPLGGSRDEKWRAQ